MLKFQALRHALINKTCFEAFKWKEGQKQRQMHRSSCASDPKIFRTSQLLEFLIVEKAGETEVAPLVYVNESVILSWDI
jgi:hypothetical protein